MREIRFCIEGKPVSDWEPEHVTYGSALTAVVRITELRGKYPDAAISIERRVKVEEEDGV